MEAHPEFAARCARAREMGQDCSVEEMQQIEGDVLKGAVDPHAARVVLSSMQWRASKIAPKKYGDKQQVEHSGSIDIGAELNERLAAARKKAAEEN